MEDASITTTILVNLTENWTTAWDTKSCRGLVSTVQEEWVLVLTCRVFHNAAVTGQQSVPVSTDFLAPHWLPSAVDTSSPLLTHGSSGRLASVVFSLCSHSKLLTPSPSLPHICPLPEKRVCHHSVGHSSGL